MRIWDNGFFRCGACPKDLINNSVIYEYIDVGM